jgi:hypothetical protein
MVGVIKAAQVLQKGFFAVTFAHGQQGRALGT